MVRGDGVEPSLSRFRDVLPLHYNRMRPVCPGVKRCSFRFVMTFSEVNRSRVVMSYACPAGCTLYTAGFGTWSGRRESNPRSQLGRLVLCH